MEQKVTPWEILLVLVAAWFVVNVLLAAVVVFYERRSPASTWAWLFVLFFIPVLGFIIYLFLGRSVSREKVFLKKAENDHQTLIDFVDQNEALTLEIEKQAFSHDGLGLSQSYHHLYDFAFLNVHSGSWLTFNNKLNFFFDGNKKFDALMDDIERAQKFIHLEYYIVRGDALGTKIVQALAKKAKEGVQVRVLYDYMGNWLLPKGFFRPLEEAGGEAMPFLAPAFVRFNSRNHRKIVVIDGKIGYVGGFNIGDEYLGRVKRFGFWRDTHVRLRGDVVAQLQIRFLMDWNYSAKRSVPYNSFFFPPVKEHFGYLPAQIVCSGPDTQWRSVQNSYFKMINEAERSVFIQTPYFVPDAGIQEALRVAALSGIDVRIMIPGKPDHPFVYWASMSYLGELLEAGVKCYQYETGFIHSKTVCIDGIAASVGTANMDVRSFRLNFEVNAFLYDPHTVEELEEKFRKDLKECTEITPEWYEKRGHRFRFKEAVSRLISPVL